MFEKTKKFVIEAVTELKKVSWTTRRELIDATWIVLVSSVMLGVYIGVIDFGLSRLLGMIVR